MVGHKQSRRFLECVHDSFLMQMTDELTRGSAQLKDKRQWAQVVMWEILIRCKEIFFHEYGQVLQHERKVGFEYL